MSQLFNYQFITNAILASFFMSITCGIVGAYIVSRRMVFIAGGLTHSSFGGIGLGYYFGISPIFGAAVFAVLSALGIEQMQRKNVRNDSAIAMFWAFGMALGIIFVYLTPGYTPNLMSYLFGSILTVTQEEVIYLGLLSFLTIVVFTLFFRLIQFVSFDEEFARAQKLPVNLVNNAMMVIIALTIVLNIRMTGIILVLSMLTIPQNIAALFVKSLRGIMVFSVGIAFLAAIFGLVTAYYLDIPAGASIIFLLTLCFAILKFGLYLFGVKKNGSL